MSVPDLSNLSLRDSSSGAALEDVKMPSLTRSQRARQNDLGDTPGHGQDTSSDEGTSSSDEDSSGESDDDLEFPVHPMPELITGPSTVEYQTQGMSRLGRVGAVAGLTGDYEIEYFSDTRNAFEFYLADHGQVRINQDTITCDCAAFAEDGTACRHMFWLVDNFFESWPASYRPKKMGTDDYDGLIAAKVYEKLKSSIEGLLREKQWMHVSRHNTDPSANDSDGQMLLRRQVQDFLAIIDSDRLPEEIEVSNFTAINNASDYAQCIVRGDLHSTICRLAAFDPHVFRSLSQVLGNGKVEACHASYQEKLLKRERTILKDYDDFVKLQDRSPTNIPSKAQDTIRKITELVDKMWTYRENRGSTCDILACQFFALTLKRLIEHNKDVFSTERRKSLPREALDSTDARNLFNVSTRFRDGLSYKVLSHLDAMPDRILATQLDAWKDMSEETSVSSPGLYQSFIEGVKKIRDRAMKSSPTTPTDQGQGTVRNSSRSGGSSSAGSPPGGLAKTQHAPPKSSSSTTQRRSGRSGQSAGSPEKRRTTEAGPSGTKRQR